MKRYTQYKNIEVLTQELSETGYRQFVCRTSYDTLRLYGNVYNYEIIRNDTPVKPYLDIEWIETDPNFNHSLFITTLKSDIIAIFAEKYSYSGLLSSDIYVATSTKDTHISYHVIINAMYYGKLIIFDNNLKTKENSAYSLCHYLLEKYSKYVGKLDTNVYTNDREFRMIYSCKSPSDLRRFEPFEDRTVDWKKYLVTYHDGLEHTIIKVPL